MAFLLRGPAMKRKLGFWSVFWTAAGAMISSRLFVLPGLVYAEAGARGPT